MSIKYDQADSVLKVVFSHGFDESNEEILKTFTFANLKNTSSHETLYDIAKKLQSLQQHEMKKVIRHEEYVLSEEAE